MTRFLRSLIAAALLVPALATAQTTPSATVGVPPSLQVSRLGPQLVLFAGGQTNFDSLVNGLALGQSVTLSTVLPNGLTQVVTFTPAGTLTTAQIAQTLESARQNLISRGIAAPTSQQLAVSLTGGTLPTQTGAVTVSALLPANVVPTPAAAAAGGTRDAAAPTTSTGVTTTVVQPNGAPSPSALMQGQSGAGGTTPPSPAAILQQQRGVNISDTPTLGNTSNTPTTATTTTTTGVASPAATTGIEPRATQQQAAPPPARETSAPASPSAIGR